MKSMLPLIGLSLQIPGAVLLYFAAIQMPWSRQTWKGESKEEKTFRKKQLTTGITGLTLILKLTSCLRSQNSSHFWLRDRALAQILALLFIVELCG